MLRPPSPPPTPLPRSEIDRVTRLLTILHQFNTNIIRLICYWVGIYDRVDEEEEEEEEEDGEIEKAEVSM